MKRYKIFKLFLILLAFFGVERFCRLQTEGFRLSKALCTHSYPYTYQTNSFPQNIHQPFYFLGSGVQFYVFLGEDQRTILKLFKHHHMGFSTDLIKKLLPPFLAQRIITTREKRMLHLFESSKIACKELMNHTGVEYLHIGKTEGLFKKICIHDKLGIAYWIDLDKTDFVLQKKAEPASQRLHFLFQTKQMEKATDTMQILIDLIKKRSKLGIKNKDGNILENCGFIHDYPIELDIGSYIYRTQSTNPDPHKKAALRAKLQLLRWVKKHYPEHLQQCRNALFHENPI